MTSPPTFDLITEPWISCETLRGEPLLLGLEQTLLRAHELGAVHDQSPLVNAMLHRVLLAILHRACAPTSLDDWTRLWNAPHLRVGKLREYFGRWRDRFDLFHPERPFLQVARLGGVLFRERWGKALDKAQAATDEARAAEAAAAAAPADEAKRAAADAAGKAADKARTAASRAATANAQDIALDLLTPAARLAPERSQHSVAAHLLARLPADMAITPAEAARSMLAFLGYTSGGRIQNDADSRKSGVLRAGAVVLLQGRSLKETLLLNLVSLPDRSATDVPPWERPETVERTLAAHPRTSATRAPHGLVDGLVWPSRRVLLVPMRGPDEAVLVRDVITAAGEDLSAMCRACGFCGPGVKPPEKSETCPRCATAMDVQPPDSMFGYVLREGDKTPTAVKIDPVRATWRDFGALVDTQTGAGRFRQPASCEQLGRLATAKVLPHDTPMHVELLGLAGGGAGTAAAIRDWRTDRLPLPLSLFVGGARVEVLRSALADAENMAGAIRSRVLYALSATLIVDPHKDVVGAHRESLGTLPAYWRALGDRFPAWLEELGAAGLEPTEEGDQDLVVTLQIVRLGWQEIVREATRAVVLHAIEDIGLTGRAIRAGAAAERALDAALAELLPLPEGEILHRLKLPAHAEPTWSDTTGFLPALDRLVKTRNLGALAALRLSRQHPRGMAPEAAQYIRPLLPAQATERQARLYYLVAAMRAEHREEASGVSLGHAFRRIHDALGGTGETSTSASERFELLLAAHPDDMGEVLAATLPWLYEHGALDWQDLLRGLLFSRRRDRLFQRRWARDFWDGAPRSSPATS